MLQPPGGQGINGRLLKSLHLCHRGQGGAVKSICEKLVNAITARENSFGRYNSNVKFKAELEKTLKDDVEFKARPTVIRLCNIVEGVVTKWTAINHDVESRKNKRE